MAEGIGSQAVVATPAPAWVAVGACLFAALAGAATFRFVITGKRHALAYVNILGTIVHEAGHALISVMAGGHVYHFKITDPDNGQVRIGHNSKLSAVASSMAGYAMPPLAGLGAAELLHRGHSRAVLILTIAIMLLVLLAVRDLLTFVCVFLVGAVAFAALCWGPVWLLEWMAYAEAWLLLISEVGGLAALVAVRWVRSRAATSSPFCNC